MHAPKSSLTVMHQTLHVNCQSLRVAPCWSVAQPYVHVAGLMLVMYTYVCHQHCSKWIWCIWLSFRKGVTNDNRIPPIVWLCYTSRTDGTSRSHWCCLEFKKQWTTCMKYQPVGDLRLDWLPPACTDTLTYS